MRRACQRDSRRIAVRGVAPVAERAAGNIAPPLLHAPHLLSSQYAVERGTPSSSAARAWYAEHVSRAHAALEAHRADIAALATAHGALNVRVFGSVARGDDDDASDLDLLVDMAEGRTLFDLGALLEDLRAVLGVPVDVVTTAGLRDRIRERVLAEAKAH